MKTTLTESRLVDNRDAGIGLIEIVVSMMILALLAIAVFPVLVQGMKTSAANATRATASQLAGQDLDLARTLNPDCATLSAFDDGPSGVAPDASGNSLEIRRSVGVCPAAYPGVVRVSITVTAVGRPTPVLASATTLVLLEKAAP